MHNSSFVRYLTRCVVGNVCGDGNIPPLWWFNSIHLDQTWAWSSGFKPISIMIVMYQVSRDGLVENVERFDVQKTVELFQKIFKNY